MGLQPQPLAFSAVLKEVNQKRIGRNKHKSHRKKKGNQRETVLNNQALSEGKSGARLEGKNKKCSQRQTGVGGGVQ